MNTANQAFPIFTKLNEIYPINQIDDKYEPLYEELRSKFKLVYNNQEPSLFIRVPYTITLFGDHITNLFPEKIVTNINSDLIICIGTSNTLELNVNYFDSLQSPIKAPIEQSIIYKSEIDYSLSDYITIGYLSGLKYIKAKTQSKAANILLMFNSVNIDHKDLEISSFLGMMITSFCINSVLPSMEEVYQRCIAEIRKLRPMTYYLSYIYYKLFLMKNSVGCNMGNRNLQGDIQKNMSCLIFDSLSAVPISYYSNSHYWNKRKIEVRLGIALIFKRFKETTTPEEIAYISKDINCFIKLFDSNIQTIFEMIDIYLKKTSYSIRELKQELGIEMKVLLDDIEFYENVLMTKDFELQKRLISIFNSYKQIMKLNCQIEMKDKINWADEINQSCKNTKENYECFSDEITTIITMIKNKYPQLGLNIISKGWSGNCIAFGPSEDIKQLESELIEIYSTKLYKEESHELTSAWISDELNCYIYSTKIGNSLCILNPQYEDFMLEFVDKKLKIENASAKPKETQEENNI